MTGRMEPTLEVQQMVTLVAQSIVDEPGQVSVDVETLEAQTMLRLRVAPGDVAVITGRDGLIGHSLRDLLSDMGLKHKHVYALEITTVHKR